MFHLVVAEWAKPMETTKPDLRVLRRLLYRHEWTDVAEWGRALSALADLSDAQIDAVVTGDGRAINGPRGPEPLPMSNP
jgi:hypothetical protein